MYIYDFKSTCEQELQFVARILTSTKIKAQHTSPKNWFYDIT